MVRTQWQCQNCGKTNYNDTKGPPSSKCCDSMDWKPIEGAPAQNKLFFQCVLCGKHPSDVVKKEDGKFYPKKSDGCSQHKKGNVLLPCVWIMVGGPSSDCKKWRCRNCSESPRADDPQLKSKGFPGMSTGRCKNSKSATHVWVRIFF